MTLTPDVYQQLPSDLHDVVQYLRDHGAPAEIVTKAETNFDVVNVMRDDIDRAADIVRVWRDTDDIRDPEIIDVLADHIEDLGDILADRYGLELPE